jgi:hypothetical protein
MELSGGIKQNGRQRRRCGLLCFMDKLCSMGVDVCLHHVPDAPIQHGVTLEGAPDSRSRSRWPPPRLCCLGHEVTTYTHTPIRH